MGINVDEKDRVQVIEKCRIKVGFFEVLNKFLKKKYKKIKNYYDERKNKICIA